MINDLKQLTEILYLQKLAKENKECMNAADSFTAYQPWQRLYHL